MSHTHYSLATRIIESISRKDVFPSEVQSLSPYIEMVMPELFALTKVDANCFCNSTRELTLPNQSRLDVVFSSNEISPNKKLCAASKNICIVENQLNAADDSHLSKIVKYVNGIRRACKKVKNLQYYWISESFDFALQDDGMVTDYADAIKESKAKFPNAAMSFHRIQYSVEKINGEVYIVFKDVDDSSADVIRVPFKYKEANATLTKEATLNIDESIKYPSVFESLTERFIYNKYVELQVPQDKTVLFLDHISVDDAKLFDVPESYVRLIELRNNKVIKSSIESFESFNVMNKKFDYIIQNPPYSGNFHLKFLESGLDHLEKNGKMIIIEPSTLYNEFRANAQDMKKYVEIKSKLTGHVDSVVFENLNSVFATQLRQPFAITSIDLSRHHDCIDFVCCGDHKVVRSLDDCNLIGQRNIVLSILNKVRAYGDMMSNHITNQPMGAGIYYAKCNDVFNHTPATLLARRNSDEHWIHDTLKYYFYACMYTGDTNNVISDSPIHALTKSSNASKQKFIYTDNIATNIYGTKEQLENWQQFIYNSRLPLFISIVLNIDNHNHIKDYMPWLVDKTYTDDEINAMFGFTDEEISLIDLTIKKYNRNSPWLKRFMCPQDSSQTNEVADFINSISK